jgi:hypothetical protein
VFTCDAMQQASSRLSNGQVHTVIAIMAATPPAIANVSLASFRVVHDVVYDASNSVIARLFLHETESVKLTAQSIPPIISHARSYLMLV